MEKQNLRKHLQELQTQLENAKTLEDKDRKELLQLVDEIKTTLSRTTEAGGYDSAIQNLEDAVQRFEVTHPQLTATMARVINSLSGMGI